MNRTFSGPRLHTEALRCCLFPILLSFLRADRVGTILPHSLASATLLPRPVTPLFFGPCCELIPFRLGAFLILWNVWTDSCSFRDFLSFSFLLVLSCVISAPALLPNSSSPLFFFVACCSFYAKSWPANALHAPQHQKRPSPHPSSPPPPLM